VVIEKPQPRVVVVAVRIRLAGVEHLLARDPRIRKIMRRLERVGLLHQQVLVFRLLRELVIQQREPVFRIALVRIRLPRIAHRRNRIRLLLQQPLGRFEPRPRHLRSGCHRRNQQIEVFNPLCLCDAGFVRRRLLSVAYHLCEIRLPIHRSGEKRDRSQPHRCRRVRPCLRAANRPEAGQQRSREWIVAAFFVQLIALPVEQRLG
jgi:hypothetical protein